MTIAETTGGRLGYPFAWRRSVPGDVAVHPLHRLGGGERKRSGDGLVQRHAERIEVAARVDGAIHATGLLGCHVGERAGDRLGRLGRLALARQARSDAEAGQANLFAVVLHKDVRRLDLPMDQAALMHLAERRCGPDTPDAKIVRVPSVRREATQAARRPGLRATAPCARRRGSAHAAATPMRCRARLRARIRGRTDRGSRGRAAASRRHHGEERRGDSSLAPASVHRALAVLDQDRQIAIPDRSRSATVVLQSLIFTMPMDLRSTVDGDGNRRPTLRTRSVRKPGRFRRPLRRRASRNDAHAEERPRKMPWPPVIAVPPTSTAAMLGSSRASAIVGLPLPVRATMATPASPAHKPLAANARVLMRRRACPKATRRAPRCRSRSRSRPKRSRASAI